MDENNTYSYGDPDENGGSFPLNKNERKLLREILSRALSSPERVQYIRNTFGEEYVQIGLELLESIGGSSFFKKDFLKE